ncbi:MAG: glycosyltransferase family 9 protein [Mariprofundaceae bacterium]
MKLQIIPPNWLGDVIMAQPAMRAIRICYPHAELTLAGQPWLADLLPCLNLADAHYVKSPQPADMTWLFPNSFRTAWQVWRMGSTQRIGYGTQWRSPLLTLAIQPLIDTQHEHHRLYFNDLVKQYGIEVREPEVQLGTADKDVEAGRSLIQAHGLDPERTFCIAPGAQFGAAKRYPPNQYAKVIEWLAADGWQPLLLGTAAEQPICEDTLRYTQETSWNSAGKTTLKQALQLLSASRLLLCNDSGLMHVAAGMGIPLVAMFGATAPERTRPSGKHVTLLYRPAVCSPCLQRECTTIGQPCMVNLFPEEVRDACLQWLHLDYSRS